MYNISEGNKKWVYLILTSENASEITI